MSKYIFVKINDDITSIKRLKEMFPKIDEEDFEDILESDPTYTNNAYEAGKYGRWLLSLFNKNNLKKEDLYKAKEYLEKFDKKKTKFSNKDINAYKNLPDLYKAIEEMENKEPTKSELKRNVQRTDLDEDAEFFMETENFKIYIPLTYEASCKLGSDTQWCTATRSKRGYYDDYTSDGNELYVMISKKDPSEKYQWNTKERYTCDRKDREISEVKLCVAYPDLAKFFDKFGYNFGETIGKLKEYANGQEYIYKGEEINRYLAPYLKKIKISNNVKRIGESAFAGCSSLESVEIPNSVLIIARYAFCGCKALTSIKLPNSITSLSENTFHGCSLLKNITLSNSITKIPNKAFYYCSSLESIEIPNSVTSIGDSAFYACSSLKSVKLPNSLISIEGGAFGNCKSLTRIEIPNSVKSIRSCTFVDCSALESIIIPNGVKSISFLAFYGCTSLKTIIISNSVETIDPCAFSDCSPDLVIKTKNPYVIEYCKQYGFNYSEE